MNKLMKEGKKELGVSGDEPSIFVSMQAWIVAQRVKDNCPGLISRGYRHADWRAPWFAANLNIYKINK